MCVVWINDYYDKRLRAGRETNAVMYLAIDIFYIPKVLCK